MRKKNEATIRPPRKLEVIPSEDDEQMRLVQWLQLKDIPHFRVPNETYTTSWKQKGKNKALGVVPGVPDIFILFRKRGLIAIEMKRIKRSKTSAAQLAWIEALNEAEVPAHVCYGADDAITLIELYLEQFLIVESKRGRVGNKGA